VAGCVFCWIHGTKLIWLRFECKRKVENHIKTLSPMNYTLLRPCNFMDNLLPSAPMMFKMGRTVLLRQTFIKHPERKQQFISGRDIGRAGAKAFDRPEQFKDRAVGLVGDELTMPQVEAIYKEVGPRSLAASVRLEKQTDTSRSWVNRSTSLRRSSPGSSRESYQCCAMWSG
jgi:hypothetical protein